MNRIFCALVGLSGAAGNNPKTPNTDRLVLEALSFPLLHPDASEEEIEQMRQAVYREKYAISPNCATCGHPCGNTSDYDITRLDAADGHIKQIKLTILSNLEQTAQKLLSRYPKSAQPSCSDSLRSAQSSCLDTPQAPEDFDRQMDFLYKGISYLSYELSEKSLLDLLAESEEIRN